MPFRMPMASSAAYRCFFAHEGRLYPSLAMQTIIDALDLEQGGSNPHRAW
jgi:hypothetical protein